ncbi:hypothetical protein [Pseudomonas batumici]|uniref:hypothetical protein n=1 Tax=Pseudomonas batumici TaxID=226910 RepID=UPI00058A26C5|nr:hypothetical protein [Pseudomonas batumici]
MTLSLQNIKPEQIDALKKQSQAAFDSQIKSLRELSNTKPALEEVLHQNVHPQSLCGCGCQQYICGYFSFEGCGCGCYPQTETIQITASPADIGPNAPQQGTAVRFVGQVTGTGTNINIPNIYLQGTVPDAENLIGVSLSLQLSISPGSLTLFISEGQRLLTVMVHPSQYAANISGQFSGSGYGIFQLA